MLRFLLILFGCFLIGSSGLFGQSVIKVTPENLNISIADKLYIHEDTARKATPQLLPRGYYPDKGRKLENQVENLDFTTSIWHTGFILDNTEGDLVQLYLEVARPITNRVVLYEYDEDDYLISTQVTGDAMPFDSKAYFHQKSVLPITMRGGQTRKFWLELESDGEIISLPFILWDEHSFQHRVQREQLFLGLFYGIFIFIFLIYLFFFIILKDKSFLFYIFYVLSSALLQFALDGFAHEFIFRSGGYWTQHFVIFIAGFTVVFVITYASSFLKLKERHKRLDRIFRIFRTIILLVVGLSLIPGKTYEIAYPMINGFSMIAIVLILVAIVVLRRKEYKIDIFFNIGFWILITGAVIFILGNFSVIDAPEITQNALKVGTLLEILFLSVSMANKYRELQREKEEAQALVLQQLEEKNELMSSLNVKLEHQVKERTAEIERQKEQLREKNDDIMSSIKYAERIQKAVLPSIKKFNTLLPDSFVLFKPRDIVSGDFFWIETIKSGEEERPMVIYAAGDCTGHGVPGAFVHIVGQNFLRLSKFEKSVNSPADALNYLNRGIKETFGSEYSDEQLRDGMDIALCALDLENLQLGFSGAKNPVYIVRDGELIELKGDKKPIGAHEGTDHISFTNQYMDLQRGDTIYTFSDGYPDQFGGPKGKKFMYGKFKKLLLSIQHLSLAEQKEELNRRFEEWRGELEQIDDVLVIGVRI